MYDIMAGKLSIPLKKNDKNTPKQNDKITPKPD